mmetsp:Transcript_4457/g.9686  ORF Transcript_4457/g.9686 Transcript_4457/m.9686 type:complete len:471 (-) Transcript_4457:188-1600(-)
MPTDGASISRPKMIAPTSRLRRAITAVAFVLALAGAATIRSIIWNNNDNDNINDAAVVQQELAPGSPLSSSSAAAAAGDEESAHGIRGSPATTATATSGQQEEEFDAERFEQFEIDNGVPNPYYEETIVLHDLECTLYLMQGEAMEKTTKTRNVLFQSSSSTSSEHNEEEGYAHDTVVSETLIDETSWICGDMASDSIVGSDNNDNSDIQHTTTITATSQQTARRERRQHQLDSVMFAELRSADLNIQDFLDAQHPRSGESRLLLSSVVLTLSTEELFIPVGASIRVETLPQIERVRNLAPSSGKLTALYVRVVTTDGLEPDATSKELFEETFRWPNGVSMAEQYRACSYDKLDIVPYLNPERDIEGIMEIVVDKTIVSGLTSRNSITNAATLKLREFFGGNFDELDLIMFCIPPGTIRMDGAQEWLSFALTNNKITYYNDQNGWCRSNSIKMHEVGHNMNLGTQGKTKQ